MADGNLKFFNRVGRGENFVINNDGSIALPLARRTSPNAPALGGIVYIKSNGKLYFKNSNGTEYDLATNLSAASAITVSLSNESHAVLANSGGTVIDSYSGAGTSIEVFSGANRILPEAGTGTPTSGYFRVAASGTNITPGTKTVDTTSGAEKMTFGVPASMNANTAKITFTITVNIDGGDYEVTKQQSFTKVTQGADGAEEEESETSREFQDLHADFENFLKNN